MCFISLPFGRAQTQKTFRRLPFYPARRNTAEDCKAAHAPAQAGRSSAIQRMRCLGHYEMSNQLSNCTGGPPVTPAMTLWQTSLAAGDVATSTTRSKPAWAILVRFSFVSDLPVSTSTTTVSPGRVARISTAPLPLTGCSRRTSYPFAFEVPRRPVHPEHVLDALTRLGAGVDPER